eukprot:2129030-Rhodomonas_salina.1
MRTLLPLAAGEQPRKTVVLVTALHSLRLYQDLREHTGRLSAPKPNFDGQRARLNEKNDEPPVQPDDGIASEMSEMGVWSHGLNGVQRSHENCASHTTRDLHFFRGGQLVICMFS